MNPVTYNNYNTYTKGIFCDTLSKVRKFIFLEIFSTKILLKKSFGQITFISIVI